MNDSDDLNTDNERIRDVYAYYGLAVYLAQNVERGLSMVLALDGQSMDMTAWDFDARLAENYQCTFGDLVSRFLKSSLAASSDLSERLQRANKQRNDLAHQYFWDRATQFVSPDGQLEMIAELRRIKAEFESLDDDLTKLQETAIKNRGEELDGFHLRVKDHFEGFLAGTKIPHNPERVPNHIEVIAIQEWRSNPNKPGNLVLISKEGRYLVPGERGICYGPASIPSGTTVRPLAFGGALPAKTNPRPKTTASWNYGIPLANGYVLRAQTKSTLRTGRFYVWIQKPQPKKRLIQGFL